MSKQSVPLSQVFDHAVNELHPSPCIKGYDTLVKIIKNIPQACVPLRIQLINKMKAYQNKFLPSLEMYYCLCFMDYACKRDANFRKQMTHVELVGWFECTGEFDKCKRRKEIKIVSDKAMRIVQPWPILFPSEMKPYKEMFIKYTKKGIHFILPDLTDFEIVTHKGNELENYVEKVSECMMMIDDAIYNLEHQAHVHSAELLLIHANELCNQFKNLVLAYQQSEQAEEQQARQLETLFKDFNRKIDLLQAKFDGEQKQTIFKTYTTGHSSHSAMDLSDTIPLLPSQQINAQSMALPDNVTKKLSSRERLQKKTTIISKTPNPVSQSPILVHSNPNKNQTDKRSTVAVTSNNDNSVVNNQVRIKRSDSSIQTTGSHSSAVNLTLEPTPTKIGNWFKGGVRRRSTAGLKDDDDKEFK